MEGLDRSDPGSRENQEDEKNTKFQLVAQEALRVENFGRYSA
jgi:hypothetical protein